MSKAQKHTGAKLSSVTVNGTIYRGRCTGCTPPEPPPKCIPTKGASNHLR